MKSLNSYITESKTENSDFKVGETVYVKPEAGGFYAGMQVTIKVIDYPYALVRAHNGKSVKYALSDFQEIPQ